MLCYVGVLTAMSMAAHASQDVQNWARDVDFNDMANLVEHTVNFGTAFFIALDMIVLATSVVQFWFGDNLNALFNKCCCCCNCFGHCCWANACFYQWLLLTMFLLQYAANVLSTMIFTMTGIILVLLYVVDGTCQVSVSTAEEVIKKIANIKELERFFDGNNIHEIDVKTWHKICHTVDDAAKDVQKLCAALLALVVIQVAFVVAARSNYVNSKFQVQLARKLESNMIAASSVKTSFPRQTHRHGFENLLVIFYDPT